jgi:hypothetical protein
MTSTHILYLLLLEAYGRHVLVTGISNMGANARADVGGGD